MIKLENILIAFYGITTVIVFVIMVSYGGLFDSVHTALFREVSYLISPYALRDDITVPLFRLYNVNLLMFSIVLLLRLKNIFAKLGAFYLSISAVTGVLLVQFPLDPIRLSQSLTGSTHIFVSLLTGFYIIIALFFFSYGFKKNKNLKKLSLYSFEFSIIILVAGFLTGMFAILSMPNYVGLTQKMPITVFLIWIIMTALWMLKSDNRVSYARQTNKRK